MEKIICIFLCTQVHMLSFCNSVVSSSADGGAGSATKAITQGVRMTSNLKDIFMYVCDSILFKNYYFWKSTIKMQIRY